MLAYYMIEHAPRSQLRSRQAPSNKQPVAIGLSLYHVVSRNTCPSPHQTQTHIEPYPDPHWTMSAPITFPHPTYKLAPLSRDADDETNTSLDGLWTRDTDHGNTMRNLVWILQQQHDPFMHWGAQRTCRGHCRRDES
jgi:hypothetical protein